MTRGAPAVYALPRRPRVGTQGLPEKEGTGVEELQGWLKEAGWRFVRHAPLGGPQSLVVATAA